MSAIGDLGGWGFAMSVWLVAGAVAFLAGGAAPRDYHGQPIGDPKRRFLIPAGASFVTFWVMWVVIATWYFVLKPTPPMGMPNRFDTRMFWYSVFSVIWLGVGLGYRSVFMSQWALCPPPEPKPKNNTNNDDEDDFVVPPKSDKTDRLRRR